MVSDEKRHKRLRLLISRLNKERKRQGKQIDILCNDFVSAQKDFLKALKVISFTADFYESIIGLTDLNELLCNAGNLIKDHVSEVNVAFFLLQPYNFELHIFESNQPIDLEDRRIENLFTTELVNNISNSNKICTLDDMLTMGLQCNPSFLQKVAIAGVPLNHHNCSLGFILLYRQFRNPFTSEELKSIVQISPGLARSISSCHSIVYNVK